MSFLSVLTGGRSGSKNGPPKLGEEQRFEDLLSNHLSGMYRVALGLTKNPVLAEDLVHDTCVRALRFQDRFEMGTHFKAWIYTVLHHTFIHRYRRKKREREILEGTTRADVQRQLNSEVSAQAAADPENSFLDRMLSDDVLVALESLSEDYRTVVTLCDLEGLSYKEIAEIIDVPVGTVMSRLYRGRRILQKKLRHVALERGIIKTPKLAPKVANEEPAQGEAADVHGNDVSAQTIVDMRKYRRQQA